MALTAAETALANQSLGKIGAKRYTAADGSFNEAQALVHFEQTRNVLLRTFEWPFAKTRLRLVSAWLTSTIYTTDQYVWQSGLLYKCAVTHTSGTFATDLTAVKWTLQSTISAWTTTPTTYVVGELVTTNALLYRCLEAHTGGTFATDLAAGKWVLSTTKPTNVFGYNYDIPADCIRLVQSDAANNEWNWYGSYTYPTSSRVANTWQLETNTILTTDTEVDIVYIDKVTTTTEWDWLFTELFVALLAKKLLAPLAGAGPGTASLRADLDAEIRELTKEANTVGAQEGNDSGSSDWNNARFY